MKKLGEYDMRKLSDSRLLYLRNPPKFTYIFVIAVIAILLGTVVWSAVTVRAEQVQVGGVITMEDKQMLTAGTTGIVYSVNYGAGDAVSPGDLVLEFDKSEVLLEIAKRESLISALTAEINNIDILLDLVADYDGTPVSSPFDQNAEDEFRFYYLFENFTKTYDNYAAAAARGIFDSTTMVNLKNQMTSQLASEINTLVINRTSYETELNEYYESLTSLILLMTTEINNMDILLDIVANYDGTPVSTPFNQAAEDEFRFYYMFKNFVNAYDEYLVAANNRAFVDPTMLINLKNQTIAQLALERGNYITDRANYQAELSSTNARLTDIMAYISTQIGYIDTMLGIVNNYNGTSVTSPFSTSVDGEVRFYYLLQSFMSAYSGYSGSMDPPGMRASLKEQTASQLVSERGSLTGSLIASQAEKDANSDRISSLVSLIMDRIGYIDTMISLVANYDGTPVTSPFNPIDDEQRRFYLMFESFVFSYDEYAAATLAAGSIVDPTMMINLKNQTELQLISERGTLAANKISYETELGSQTTRLTNMISLMTRQIGYTNTMLGLVAIYDGTPVSSPFSQSDNEQAKFHYMFESFSKSYDEYLALAITVATASDPTMLISLKNQTIAQLASERGANAINMTPYVDELDSYNELLTRYDIKATILGIIHFDAQIRKGTVLQIGDIIGSISNPYSDRVIEMYIGSGDRSKIDVNQECSFIVDGLAQTEYGSIKGTVKSISSDAILQERGAFFRVVVEFDAEYMEDSKGGKIYLTNGMTVRAWVTYEKVTYMKYWLDQLGLGEYI
ncbi:MAG: HlyD family secretion protein [Methanomassiliicoccaceae archaeon]|nr:HlyD family secretion protein [Methanomassiliicoccaceae archaeon]